MSENAEEKDYSEVVINYLDFTETEEYKSYSFEDRKNLMLKMVSENPLITIAIDDDDPAVCNVDVYLKALSHEDGWRHEIYQPICDEVKEELDNNHEFKKLLLRNGGASKLLYQEDD